MVKKICFFTIGFAFNRLVRMQYYEKIFPKDVKIYIFTTNKYEGKEEANYQDKWDLNRTEIKVADYNPLKLFFSLRKFCREEEIDRMINIGTRFNCLLLFFATLFLKTDYIMNILGSLSYSEKTSYKEILEFIFLYPLIKFSRRTLINDLVDHKRYSRLIGKKVVYLPAVIDTNIFKLKNKQLARKKLKLPKDKKIILYVGRVYHLKCSDILVKLIKENPDIYFVVIGPDVDKEISKLKVKNLKYFKKKSSKELADFYNAADLSFLLHRPVGGGLGFTAEESLASGTPVITAIKGEIETSPALFQLPPTFEASTETINTFFKLSSKKRKELSKLAQDYGYRNYSGKVWKKRYIDYYLN